MTGTSRLSRIDIVDIALCKAPRVTVFISSSDRSLARTYVYEMKLIIKNTLFAKRSVIYPSNYVYKLSRVLRTRSLFALRSLSIFVYVIRCDLLWILTEIFN